MLIFQYIKFSDFRNNLQNDQHLKCSNCDKRQDKWGISWSFVGVKFDINMSDDNTIKCEDKKDVRRDNGDNIQDEYKEKTRGKEVCGEFIIDGFTFKGKRGFKRVKEGLEDFMKK